MLLRSVLHSLKVDHRPDFLVMVDYSLAFHLHLVQECLQDQIGIHLHDNEPSNVLNIQGSSAVLLDGCNLENSHIH